MDVLLILINGIYILPNNFNYSSLFRFFLFIETNAFFFGIFFENEQGFSGLLILPTKI
ncbi:hypothetical protein MmTuc01_0671 [Methanosarcina mazei Tuc01]|uniref:Uncharacterized protein n=1 Tax=Methanosarcina mazei Tuc01 TaxID=1236903 RepID=M1QGG1_METMZ|nr:hypothetical protein MmTuc01_0671 [Methanosarcina mazei Tuc01]